MSHGMPKGYSYGREKLTTALFTLASAEGSPKERLYKASRDLSVIREDLHLPEEVRDRFAEIREAMTWVAPSPEDPESGTLRATLAVMSDSEVKRLISRIHALAIEVAEILAREKPGS